jgi:hypothetical protein
VDVGVAVLVVALDGVEDRAGLLRRVGRVEVDQALAPDDAVEDGEVLADARHVERRRRGHGSLVQRHAS